MIFSALNERGVPLWKLVLNNSKVVTRRPKPQPVGALRAVWARKLAESLQDAYDTSDKYMRKEDYILSKVIDELLLVAEADEK